MGVFFLPLLRLFAVPGRCLYRAVADHRVFSWKVYCLLRPRVFNQLKLSVFFEFAAFLFVLFSLVSILLQPLVKVIGLSAEFSGGMSSFLRIIGVKQSWKMFSPHPLKKDGWLVVDVEKDGVRKSYYAPSLQMADKPSLNPSVGVEIYGNQRKRKYFENLRLKKSSPAHDSYCHLCVKIVIFLA